MIVVGAAEPPPRGLEVDARRVAFLGVGKLSVVAACIEQERRQLASALSGFGIEAERDQVVAERRIVERFL